MKIYQHNVFESWPLEDESVQAVITSPPYYALRKYFIPDVIIGRDKACKHEFGLTKEKLLNLQAGNPEFKRAWREDASQSYNHGSICIHCKAWKGQYGLEPTPDCGQPFMKLKENLTKEEKEYVLNELRKYGAV